MITLIPTKPVALVTVIDPDTKLPVEVEIRKLEGGAMVGLDASYLADLDGDPQENFPMSPYDPGVGLLVPDDETDVKVQEFVPKPPLTAFGFSVDDVITQGRQDGVELTEDEAEEVLQKLLSKGDASVGVNWDTISYWISELGVGKPTEGDRDESS